MGNNASLFQLFIESMLRKYPVEYQVPHPLEDILKEFIAAAGDSFRVWLLELLTDGNIMFADLLKLLGRIDPAVIGDWYLSLTKCALEHPSDTIRSAAVSAIESWSELFGDKKSLALLQDHHEESPWLRERITQLFMRRAKKRFNVTSVCEFLNELVDLDPQAMQELITMRARCNTNLAKHPFVVQAVQHAGENYIGFLGVLNGLLLQYGIAPIVALFDSDGNLRRFSKQL